MFGADGPTVPAGGVVGVKAGSDTSNPVLTGVGAIIPGTFGKLTLNADGSYSYDGDPNVVPPIGATDTFVYTIKDGDGDTSTTTLTITLTDAGLVAATDNDALVNEAALDTNLDGLDLAPGTVTGSIPASTAETDATNTLAGSVTGGTGPYTYALVSSATGTYGTIQINSDGTYIYTLTKPYDTSPDADNSTNTEDNRDSFTYQATDANGNAVQGTIVVDITDDIPKANADTNTVTEGGVVAGNVLTDGTDDVFGADGPTVPAGGVVGVKAGSDTSNPVLTGVGAIIPGTFGKLTLNADGSYSYDGDPNVVPPIGATDTFVYTIKDGDGDTSTTTLTITLTDAGLVAATDNDALVNEAALDTNLDGLDLAPGTVTGSIPASTAETDATNTLAGSVTGGTGPYTYALVSSATGTYGTIQINSDGTYIYTLTKPYDTSPDADNGTNTEDNRDSFTYQATDANGNAVQGTIVVDITDDIPKANADTNTVTEGGVVAGNVLTDGTDDVFGADGPTVPAGGVVGVKAGSDTSNPVLTGVGAIIPGTFGKLTLNADGSYSYDGDPNVVPPIGATDTFVYTIKDGDGDTSTTTLTITLTDAGLVAATDNDALVNEAALDTNLDGLDLAPGTVTGSIPASTAETDATNTLAGSVTGGTGPYTYALVGSATGTYGTIQINSDGTYVYTLTKPYDTSPDADNSTNTEDNRDSFTYQATDANGNAVQGTIVVDITDDIPKANADTNTVTEGGVVAGNVLTDGTDDVFGADGPTVPAGGVVGVKAGSDTSNPALTGVGAIIPGTFGKLTLNADGSYSYDGDPNVVPPIGATDTFVYTIKDGDGDTSTTTLTITLTDAGLVAATDNDALVNEAALDTNLDGLDLAPGTVTGSIPASTAETDATNTLAGSVTGGTGPYTYALVSSATGTYGTIQINSDGTYIYALTKPYDTSPDADNSTNTEDNRDSFTYQATDANGNTVQGTIVVDITDDIPNGKRRYNTVTEGGVVTGNVLTDGTADVFGADGPTVRGWRCRRHGRRQHRPSTDRRRCSSPASSAS